MSGIDKEQTNETLVNYLEIQTNRKVDELLRTEDDNDHAIVAFQDQIGNWKNLK